jgi:hypothetical protein
MRQRPTLRDVCRGRSVRWWASIGLALLLWLALTLSVRWQPRLGLWLFWSTVPMALGGLGSLGLAVWSMCREIRRWRKGQTHATHA